MVRQTDRHKKRLYYLPGLISLVLLPTLCIWNLDKQKAFDVPRVMEITWWNKIEELPFLVHPDIEFIDINITGDDKQDKIKLDLAQLDVRQIVATKDTTKGVHFHFDDHAKYWTLIRALDICGTEHAKTYVPNDNDVWVYNYDFEKSLGILCKQPPRIEGGNCIPLLINEKELNKQIEIEKQEKINYLINTARTFWLSGFLFMVMTILTIIRLWRQHH